MHDLSNLHQQTDQNSMVNHPVHGQPINQTNKQSIELNPTNLSTIRSVTPPTNQSTRVINRRVIKITRSGVDNEDQGLNQSTNGSTNQSTSQSISQSMSNQSINQLIDQSIIEHSSSQTISGRRSLQVVRKIKKAHQRVNLPTNRSTNRLTNQPTNQPTSQLVVQPTNHSSIRSTSSVVRPGKRVYSDNEADDRPTNRMRREINESIDQSVDQSVDQSTPYFATRSTNHTIDQSLQTSSTTLDESPLRPSTIDMLRSFMKGSILHPPLIYGIDLKSYHTSADNINMHPETSWACRTAAQVLQPFLSSSFAGQPVARLALSSTSSSRSTEQTVNHSAACDARSISPKSSSGGHSPSTPSTYVSPPSTSENLMNDLLKNPELQLIRSPDKSNIITAGIVVTRQFKQDVVAKSLFLQQMTDQISVLMSNQTHLGKTLEKQGRQIEKHDVIISQLGRKIEKHGVILSQLRADVNHLKIATILAAHMKHK